MRPFLSPFCASAVSVILTHSLLAVMSAIPMALSSLWLQSNAQVHLIRIYEDAQAKFPTLWQRLRELEFTSVVISAVWGALMVIVTSFQFNEEPTNFQVFLLLFTNAVTVCIQTVVLLLAMSAVVRAQTFRILILAAGIVAVGFLIAIAALSKDPSTLERSDPFQVASALGNVAFGIVNVWLWGRVGWAGKIFVSKWSKWGKSRLSVSSRRQSDLLHEPLRPGAVVSTVEEAWEVTLPNWVRIVCVSGTVTSFVRVILGIVVTARYTKSDDDFDLSAAESFAAVNAFLDVILTSYITPFLASAIPTLLTSTWKAELETELADVDDDTEGGMLVSGSGRSSVGRGGQRSRMGRGMAPISEEQSGETSHQSSSLNPSSGVRIEDGSVMDSVFDDAPGDAAIPSHDPRPDFTVITRQTAATGKTAEEPPREQEPPRPPPPHPSSGTIPSERSTHTMF